jgi:hypothetical protein
VGDDEQQRRQKKEGEQRQLDIEERQLDRVLQEQVGVGDGASGDTEVEQDKEVR